MNIEIQHCISKSSPNNLEYSLEDNQIVSNRSSGSSYLCEKFKESFSQTCHPIKISNLLRI
ncbi:hypothetical protein J2TS4_58340 [Paenibacillus sp. J2TS4]|nr:hypothetical protein J2TS4_58340 [Paenibacillus sp. J2TS4]